MREEILMWENKQKYVDIINVIMSSIDFGINETLLDAQVWMFEACTLISKTRQTRDYDEACPGRSLHVWDYF